MIKLQVLRYMGILTVMKLSVCAVSALSLLIAFTWFLLYCPSNIIHGSSTGSKGNVHSSRNTENIADYFDQYDIQLNKDIKSGNMVRENDKDVQSMQKNGNVVRMALYKDEAFETMITQLEHKDVEGFEFMAESTNVTIYRKPKGNSGLYQYKLYAILPNASPEQITSVFLDNEYRLVWDAYVTELRIVKKNDRGPDVIYFNVDYPWPLANRDYVYSRETRKLIRDGKEYITLVMHSVLEDSVPLVTGTTRVDDYHQSLAMTKYGAHGTKAYIEYYDDPKGSVPSWLINWAAKTGVPGFLKDLQRACGGLDGYLQKNHKTMMSIPVYKPT